MARPSSYWARTEMYSTMREMSPKGRKKWWKIFLVLAFVITAGQYPVYVYQWSPENRQNRQPMTWQTWVEAYKAFRIEEHWEAILLWCLVIGVFIVIALAVHFFTKGKDNTAGTWQPRARSTEETRAARPDMVELSTLPPALRQWVQTAVKSIDAPMQQDKARTELAQHAKALYDELYPLWGDRAEEQALARLGSAETVAADFDRAEHKSKPGTWRYYTGLALVWGSLGAAGWYWGVGHLLKLYQNGWAIYWQGVTNLERAAQGFLWLFAFFGPMLCLLSARTAVREWRAERREAEE